MLAISVRQPWAWLILHAGKDIENRTWPTRYRGRVLLHASKGMTRDDFNTAALFAFGWGGAAKLPQLASLQRGGFVGSVEIVDCVSESDSHWFMGPYGFVLRAPCPMPFVPWARGRLRLFEVPDAALAA